MKKWKLAQIAPIIEDGIEILYGLTEDGEIVRGTLKDEHKVSHEEGALSSAHETRQTVEWVKVHQSPEIAESSRLVVSVTSSSMSVSKLGSLRHPAGDVSDPLDEGKDEQ